MHDADNEVTQADRDAYEALMHDEHYDDLDTGCEHFARHRLASIEAACREKDAEIAKVRVTWARSLSRVVKERDQLRAKLDEANEIIAALLDIKHGDEKE
ncbi:hypothetical protein, partial [Sphingobium jiangsuense]